MRVVSPVNQINYGPYDESLDWNLQNYQALRNGKVLAHKQSAEAFTRLCRIHLFHAELLAELEILAHQGNLRIVFTGYDQKREAFLHKSWTLSKRQFLWEGTPETYCIKAKNLGLYLSVDCSPCGTLSYSFRYFDYYSIRFRSQLQREELKPLRNINPFDLESWAFNEKHGLLQPELEELCLDGQNYPLADEIYNLSYEWMGGYLPKENSQLRCLFWQDRPDVPQLGASLLALGHDSCSSESAIWIKQRVRYRLPRVVPSFQYGALPMDQKLHFPDNGWSFCAQDHLQVKFQPFSTHSTQITTFPLSKSHRLYGHFYGQLFNHMGEVYPIQRALGFIDYQQNLWRRR